MKPQWYSVDQIPYESMWKDDEIWYPLLFQKKLFRGKFHFKDNDQLLDYEVKELDQTGLEQE